jgi:hypothetical protein
VERRGTDEVIKIQRQPPNPREFGLIKAAYTVRATLDLLSIGRTSLYAAINRGELHPVKFGAKTLFYAADLAAFLAKLREASEPAEAVGLKVSDW